MVNQHSLIISKELNIMRKNVSATIRLLDDGATVPFIARYRKEATGSLDEVTIHTILVRHQALTEIFKRRDFIIKAIKDHKAMTPELQQRIEECIDPAVLEDIYMPFKPHRRSRAEAAREKGFEPLARIIMAQKTDDLNKCAAKYMPPSARKGAFSIEEALVGASDIIAEWVSESEKARAIVRAKYVRNAVISSKVVAGKENEGKTYQNYFNYSEPLRLCTSHRYLALRRAENEGILKINVSIDDEEMTERLCRMFVKQDATDESAAFIRAAVKDGYRRLLRPSIETEVSASVKEKSDTAAIAIFADNVKQLLMAPPLGHKRVLAVDPGFRTGCKVVALDEQGNLMAHEVIYPCSPHNDFYTSSDIVCGMVDRFRIDIIAVGNGSAGREAENFLSSLRYPRHVSIVMVSEQGASIYSASEVARREFPNEDVTVRGAVSIGRRLIDPLAELVKIDPQSIGVGQYQHDVNQTRLREALDFTVESCVTSVGVNLNTASRELLSYVSGIGPQLAANIVAFRAEHGDFTSRRQLMDVPRMGEKSFQQCAGFLRIPGAQNPLDATGVHPERYELVECMAADAGTTTDKMIGARSLLHNIDLDNYISKDAGLPTLQDIITELEKPGRDPRGEIEEPVYDDSVRTIADLHIGQELSGKINNITGFGAFVDLGLKENGLIHISQLSDDFISSPSDVVRVGQLVKVKVMDIDIARGRITLTMKGVPQ